MKNRILVPHKTHSITAPFSSSSLSILLLLLLSTIPLDATFASRPLRYLAATCSDNSSSVNGPLFRPNFFPPLPLFFFFVLELLDDLDFVFAYKFVVVPNGVGLVKMDEEGVCCCCSAFAASHVMWNRKPTSVSVIHPISK